MGKKGELLRQAKKDNTKYTFTRTELEARDRRLLEERKEHIMAKCYADVEKVMEQRKKEMDDIVAQEWKERSKEFNTGKSEEDFYQLLSYFLCISSRVLIEHYGWKTSNRKDSKIMQFGDLLIQEIEKISSDDLMDIRRYNDETFEKYGIRFTRKEED